MMNQPVPVGTGLPDLIAKMTGLFGPGAQEKTASKKAEKSTPEEKTS